MTQEGSSKYSPVVVFCYNRLNHISTLLQSLDQCVDADNTELFIFVDGPKDSKADDKQSVAKVQEHVEKYASISRFKSVKYTFATENKGLAESVISGVSYIIKKYKRVIVVEDDLKLSPYFLRYMNEALSFYEERKKIWSISGYTPIVRLPENYKEDLYFTTRGCSWGWATWLDRWEGIDWQCSDYDSLKYRLYYKRLLMKGGYDLYGMLARQMNGEIDSWAVRWCYNQAKKHCLTVYPAKSLVVNGGMDGSGTHCDASDRYDVELSPDYGQNVRWIKEKRNSAVSELFKKSYGPGTLEHLVIRLKYHLRIKH